MTSSPSWDLATFAAECRLDVDALRDEIEEAGQQSQFREFRLTRADQGLPSVDVVVKTTLSRSEFVAIMLKVPDSHVMRRTLTVSNTVTSEGGKS